MGLVRQGEGAMTWIALKMLMGDRSKDFALVFEEEVNNVPRP
jgi:hypothetical protein